MLIEARDDLRMGDRRRAEVHGPEFEVVGAILQDDRGAKPYKRSSVNSELPEESVTLWAARTSSAVMGGVRSAAGAKMPMIAPGSLEDLWAFNEEVLARAIAGSTIPVISCVVVVGRTSRSS